MVSKVGSEFTIELMQRTKQWKIEIDRAYVKEVHTTVAKDLEL